ncbi:alpha/beta fold hydrolase [Actinokineospora pegani]|uniref:alpha/beta fold hydrolase n=1 Tax=Actinokineospora pegani TaxID=2654637 RepID=UPI001F213CE6|nr:alpha/beta hydrolase [Actinokineospora pegani]
MDVTQPRTGGHTAVLLPGTGSDDRFVRAVFERPLAIVGVRLVAPRPQPGPDLLTAHLAALDEAAAHGPVLVGGISLGAHLAAEWAGRNPDRCAGLLLALPGWTGEPDEAPAAVAATHGAADVRARGVEAALETAVAGVAPWLAEELTRAWTGYGPALADSMLAAAGHAAPTAEELARLDVPAGVATCLDDPVHPTEVARRWARALPRAALTTTRLDIMGADREALGRAAVLGLLRARSGQTFQPG